MRTIQASCRGLVNVVGRSGFFLAGWLYFACFTPSGFAQENAISQRMAALQRQPHCACCLLAGACRPRRAADRNRQR